MRRLASNWNCSWILLCLALAVGCGSNSAGLSPTPEAGTNAGTNGGDADAGGGDGGGGDAGSSGGDGGPGDAGDADAGSATLTSIAILPADSTLIQGMSTRLMATGSYSDGTMADITEQVTWSSSDPGVATVNDTAGSKGMVQAVASGSSTITASLDGASQSTTLTVSTATLMSLQVEPPLPTFAASTNIALSAIGTYTDGTTADVTAQVTWTSSDMAIATVSNVGGSEGTLSGVAAGQVTITAELDGVQGTTEATITSATVTGVTVEPALATITPSGSQAFAAFATFSDGSVQDVTDQVDWASSATAAATVDAAGLASGVATGSAEITASYSGQTGSAALTVSEASLLGIEVTPATASIAAGTRQGFSAIGTFDDGTRDLTGQVIWSSSDDAVATVDAAGVAQGLMMGTITVTASFGGQAGTADLEVTEAALVSIEVTPVDPSRAVDSRVQFEAVGTYDDGTSQDLTHQVSWASDDPAVATLANSAHSAGMARMVAPGMATVSASLGGITGTSALTVTDATVTGIRVEPATASVPVDATVQFEAIGEFSDGSEQNLTDSVAWSASPGSIASVGNAPGRKGLTRGKAPGVGTITASLGGQEGSAMLTVTEAVLTSITVTPADSDAPLGTDVQFRAMANYDNGNTRNVTAEATWSSGTPAVATIDGDGLAESLTEGSTSIQAELDGTMGATTLTVTAPALVSIAVTPADPAVVDGAQRQLSAMGMYTDGSTMDITEQVSWTSNDSGVASVSDTAGSKGLVTGEDPGTTDIMAGMDGVDGMTTVTVTPAG